jgi:hypothetical protein
MKVHAGGSPGANVTVAFVMKKKIGLHLESQPMQYKSSLPV